MTQSDAGGGAARRFWARQRLRASPQATLLLAALHRWDATNEVYHEAVPMLSWLLPAQSDVHMIQAAGHPCNAQRRSLPSFRATVVRSLHRLTAQATTATRVRQARESAEAQRQATAQQQALYRATRHTRRVSVRLRGAMLLLPPIVPLTATGDDAGALPPHGAAGKRLSARSTLRAQTRCSLRPFDCSATRSAAAPASARCRHRCCCQGCHRHCCCRRR
mmetsp:Transcript_17919/g.58998  ORF Transcript_17919/g.58998 Transcript_17919/m.58998 type:complete len:220 (-) Transcript_17919:390-1049(-)